MSRSKHRDFVGSFELRERRMSIHHAAIDPRTQRERLGEPLPPIRTSDWLAPIAAVALAVGLLVVAAVAGTRSASNSSDNDARLVQMYGP
jgi:hypothetical protein